MSGYEIGVQRAWRGLMRGAEARIDRVGTLGTPLAKPVGAETPPTLLVHGFGNTSSAFGAVQRSLERDGFRVTTIDLPNFGFGDAMEDARLVATRVDEIRAATGSDVVNVVGHSRGGLVARAAQQLLEQPSGIGRVVTLASANGGLHLGPLDRALGGALPEGMQQIRRGSSLITDLHATRGMADAVAVGTNGFDGVLAPAGSARIDGAPFRPVDVGRTIGPISRVGHYGILRDDRAFEAIRDALTAAS
ncbi:MAG: lipase class 2 [Thermoleophilia bacterium]|nr:lipase class 2 [Thermoleophilia bacterium]